MVGYNPCSSLSSSELLIPPFHQSRAVFEPKKKNRSKSLSHFTPVFVYLLVLAHAVSCLKPLSSCLLLVAHRPTTRAGVARRGHGARIPSTSPSWVVQLTRDCKTHGPTQAAIPTMCFSPFGPLFRTTLATTAARATLLDSNRHSMQPIVHSPTVTGQRTVHC